MSNRKHVTPLRLPMDLVEIPENDCGIYIFRLRFPSDYELGLKEVDMRTIGMVLGRIEKRLEIFHSILNDSDYSGHIEGPVSSNGHLKAHIKLKGKTKKMASISEYLSRITANISEVDALISITSAFRSIVEKSPPIYVGIAQKQTLRSRLSQHADYQTHFAKRLRKAGLAIDDLHLEFHALSSKLLNSVGDIETLVQYLFKPTMSLR